MGDLSFRLHTGNGELIQDELNFAEGKLKIDGVKIPSGTEVGVLDGVTAGTVTASKAVVVGTNKNIDTISIADGGLKLGSGAGTAVTATAAELNFLDTSVAGIAVASKALVLGADKNIDTIVIADSGLKLGAGAGTAVTATAAELNLLDTSVAGTAVASKALVLGADKNIDTIAIADSGLRLGSGAGTAVTATAAELNLLDTSVAGTAVASKALVLGADKNIDTIAIADSGLRLGSGAGTAVTATAAELNKCDGIPATAYQTVMEEVLFTEAGEGTYTGTIALPAGARIIDIGVDGIALWDAATSASIVVGDSDTADGFFTETDLKSTDLLAGEINNIEHPGGKAGAYIASEQRKLYAAGARNVIGVVTTVGAGTAGRTRLYVVYAVATAAAATKS